MSKKSSIELIRHGLGIIDLSDVEAAKDMSEGERKDYCAVISAVFPRLEKDIKKFLYDQLIKTSMQAETWDQVLVGRGVFAGMEILLEHWKTANDEHFAKVKESNEPKFDKFNPISSVDN